MNFLFSFFDMSQNYFLKIGDFGITWYAVCILLGVFLAWVLGSRECKRLGISKGLILDGLIPCVPLAIIGARIWYVIFDKDGSYNSFVDYIAIWKGGLAIMGGVVVAIIFVIVYCRMRKFSALATFDLLAPGLLIGQACGRWGNWFNGEAHGGPMSEALANIYNKFMPWIMNKMHTDYTERINGIDDVYPNHVGYWHPTFLYESLWNLLGLVIILISRRKLKKVQIGDFIAFYMIWYGVGRSCLIEPFRTDPLYIGSLKVNILIPATMAVIGLVWLILKRIIKKLRAPYYQFVLKEVKDNKFDTVVIKAENTFINIQSLLRNAYYYTFKDIYKKELTDRQIAELVKKNYQDVLESQEGIEYFNKFMLDNIDQAALIDRPKQFFKNLYVKNYNILVYSNFDKEILETFLLSTGIYQYVSVYHEDTTNIKDLKNTFTNEKNALFISNRVADIVNANKCGFKTCFVTTKDDTHQEKEINYKATSFELIGDRILLF